MSCDPFYEPQQPQAPCPHCFESCGYLAEHGNDWHSGPYSHITAIPCRECHGTGYVDAEDATDTELFEDFNDAMEALVA